MKLLNKIKEWFGSKPCEPTASEKQLANFLEKYENNPDYHLLKVSPKVDHEYTWNVKDLFQNELKFRFNKEYEVD